MCQPQSCEYCKAQIHCRNLYVALKILEEELRFANREDLGRAFAALQNDVVASGFSYPEGTSCWALARNAEDARRLVERANGILRALRRVVTLNPA